MWRPFKPLLIDESSLSVSPGSRVNVSAGEDSISTSVVNTNHQPLLKEGRVDFAGQFYQARDCEIAPRGPSPNGLPLLIAAFGPGLAHLMLETSPSAAPAMARLAKAVELFRATGPAA